MRLFPTYFGPISWYRELLRTDGMACIDADERYVKQTIRNRCRIATANGVQTLSVPVTVPSAHCKTSDVLVSNHGNWRHQHWEALCSAYGMSPFFDYYADELLQFFTEKWQSLADYDRAITQKMLDFIVPKGCSLPIDASSDVNELRPYYQTFERRHGFQPDLSILDLLFNMGPEAILYLK